MKYKKIVHNHNNRSAMPGILRPSSQIVRHESGHDLPHDSCRILRAFRSKYEPHVGAKQLAKLNR